MPAQGGSRNDIVAALLLAVAANLAACGGGDPPETGADLAAAETSATQRTAEAREQAAGPAAGSAHDVAIAQAEGAHKVAAERCDALSGDARRSCRARADLELERARTAARQARDGGVANAP